jgi:glycosyltransferase involved in cell wall biosynthesis
MPGAGSKNNSLVNSNGPQILLAASVPVHFRAFHLPWVKRLRELGCIVHGAADRISEMPECVAAFNTVHDIAFPRSPLKLAAARVAGATLARVLEQNKIDLLHVHTPVTAFVARKYANPFRARGLKTIYTAHGFHFHDHGHPMTNVIFKLIEQRAGAWTDYIVVINHDDEEAARALEIVPRDRIVFMPGVGIDLEQFSPARVSASDTEKIREELKLSPQDKLVTMVAEFTRNKRHRDIVQALARLSRPHIHIAFVGEGDCQTEVEAQTAQLGLQKNIHFLGYRRDVPALFRTATCATLTSQREGLPRSVMEALCLEVPVVGSDARGIRDLLAGGGGSLVPVGDVAKLGEAICDIVDNPEKGRAMGMAGRRSMAQYSLGNVMKLNEQLYRRALGERFRRSNP